MNSSVSLTSPSRIHRYRVEATVRPAPAPASSAGPCAETCAGFLALLRRYLVHDLAGWIGALSLGCVAQQLGGGLWEVALAATAGDSLGFYGSAWRSAARREQRRGRPVGWRTRLRRLAREFAFAEVLDAVAVRPVAIGIATVAGASTLAGIAVGGGLADVLFYVCAWNLRSQGRRA